MIDGSLFILTAANPIHHVTDKPLFGWVISNYTVMLVINMLVTLAILVPAAKRIATGKSGTIDDLHAKGVLANMVEAICVYLREETFRPVLREQTDRFTPMLWTFFWFILINNLMGLLPVLDIMAAVFHLLGKDGHAINHGHGIWGTPTQSIWVTATLATFAFFFINGVAIVKNPIGFLKHMTGGAPIFMWPIMIPVELIGLIVKPVALALRLFANMTGGHIIVASLLGFVPELIKALGGVGGGISIIPILGTTAINLLEILVAFIQAFVFTFLTCIFLGQLVVHDEDHGEHHEAHEDNPHALGVDVHQVEASENHPQIANSHAAGKH